MKVMRVLGIVNREIEELKFREVRIEVGEFCRLRD